MSECKQRLIQASLLEPAHSRTVAACSKRKRTEIGHACRYRCPCDARLYSQHSERYRTSIKPDTMLFKTKNRIRYGFNCRYTSYMVVGSANVVVVVVVFTLNRSFYPSTSVVRPLSALILHPREIQFIICEAEKIKNCSPSNQVIGK